MEDFGRRYSEFTQAVRRYRPSALLPIVAAMTARFDPNYHGYEDIRGLPPWSMNAIARESIVRGNEHRQESPSPSDILRLAQLHHEVFVEPTKGTLTAIVGPMMHEQLWWQLSLYEEQTRTVSLFDDPRFGPVLDWEAELGLPLADAVRASFIVGLAVNRNGGRWDPLLLDTVYADPRFEQHSTRESVEATASLLTSDIGPLREMGRAYDQRRDNDPDLIKHPLNPLMGYPLVNLGEHGTWAPVGPLVWRALLPQGLYVRGRARWRGQFTDSLGGRFENYVGALAENVHAKLLPQITFGKRGGSRSVDWMWVSKEAVVLIECKSSGLGIDAHAGGGRFRAIVDRTIGEGRRQIDRTATHILAATPEFDAIPNDRPIFGLVVTAEPFPMANAGLEEYGPPGETPTLICSAREFEHLTSLEDAIAILRSVFEDEEKRTFDLAAVIRDHRPKKHPVSETAWNKIGPARPWSDS